MKLDNWYPEADVFFKKIHEKPVSHNKTRFDRKKFESEAMRQILTKPSRSSDAKWIEKAKRSIPKPVYDQVVLTYKNDFDAFSYSRHED